MKIPRGQTEERRAYMKAYNESHPKRDRRAYKSAYDKAHKEEISAYYAENRAVQREKDKVYYLANRDRILANVKARAVANPEAISDYHSRHYIANEARIKARVSAYAKANPDKMSFVANRRRIRKLGNGGSHTFAERKAKFESLGNVCFYCGKSGRLTIDHDMPVTRGGSDDIENILPACRSCNSRKHDKTAKEFFAWVSRTNHSNTGGSGPKPQQEYTGR